ncbi:MAG: hypothetical protein HND47_00395 [Chloroflexi bacterium]|nr:hypothetical protein [Chloroflexota bacterium]
MAEASLIQNATKLLAESRAAVAFTGAGISTPSGIPDFRSPKTGLWACRRPPERTRRRLAPFRHSDATLGPFYERMKPLFQDMITAEPNAAHYALAELEARGIIQAVITQNADMLHQRAGSKNVIEVHGSLAEATCIQCYNVKPFRPLLDQFLSDGIVPRCKECGGAMKPNVILTGEQLPVRAMLAAQQAIRRSDILLVAGTSLAGGPSSTLVDNAYLRGLNLVIVNQSPTLLDQVADVIIHADVATVLPAIVKAFQGIQR